MQKRKIISIIFFVIFYLNSIPFSYSIFPMCCPGTNKEGLWLGRFCLPVSCSYRCGAECVGQIVGGGEVNRVEECSVRRGEHVYYGVRECRVDTCTYTECAPGQFCGNKIKEGTEECEPPQKETMACGALGGVYTPMHKDCAANVERQCLPNCKWGEWSKCPTIGRVCGEDCMNTYPNKQDFAPLEKACPKQVSEEEYWAAGFPNDCYYRLIRTCRINTCNDYGSCSFSKIEEKVYYCKSCETENCLEKREKGEGGKCEVRDGKHYVIIPEWICYRGGGNDRYCPKGNCGYHGYNILKECKVGCRDGKCIDEEIILIGRYACPKEACSKISESRWDCDLSKCSEIGK